MKEKKDWKKKVLTKKNISLFGQITVIVLVFILFVLADYLSFSGSLAFMTDWVYWVTTTLSLMLIVALMITVRNMRKDKQIEINENINNNMQTVQAVRKVVLINAYDDMLQEYIDKVNEDYKYETYVNNITKKINKLLILPMKQEKKDAKLRKYEEELKKPREEVLKMHIKFNKITQTGLFAGVNGKLSVISKHDISTHETKDIADMIGYKAIMVYLITAFSGTLAVSFFFYGWAAIWGTLLKIFSAVFSTNSAIRQADNFVDYNIEQALDNRLRIILGFVNSNEEVKQKVLEKLAEEKSKKLVDNNNA